MGIIKLESKPAKFCPGCGYYMILSSLGKVLEDKGLANKSVFMTDIGCNLLAWDYFNLPSTQTHHGRTVATATGYKLTTTEKIVCCLMGDGGGYAIGLQNLIHACLRDTPITIIVANNLDYSMTGGQVSPTTLENQKTDSTPFGKRTSVQGQTLFGPELLTKVASKEAYLARTSTRKPQEITEFINKAIETQKSGHFALVEVISACPVNWRLEGTNLISRMEELEKILPQGEIK
jgi:2-oxoglutarate/2-oxoacid ferredoxin oxidoreductase subunit beta